MRNLECLWKVWYLLTVLFNPVRVINVHVNVSDLRGKWDHNPGKATFGFCSELNGVMSTYLELNFELEESQCCAGGSAD